MNQIALPLVWPADEKDTDFIITSSNAEAVKRIQAISTWPVSAMILSGPRKSGRSLFGRIFAARHNASLIDNADTRDETALFHAWNAAQAARQPLLMIANAPPPVWQVQLPDLRSRLAATPAAAFGDPDEPLMHRLFTYLCERRSLAVGPGLTAWLIPRLERSHRALLAVVDQLDSASLSQRRSLSIPFARSVLGSAAEETVED
jgi:hypothetical protein